MTQPATETVPPQIAVIARPVEARLAEVLSAERTRWTTVDPQLGPPLDALARLVLGGGKRLRPAFAYWGYVAAGGDVDDPCIVDIGAAFELLHAFALVHDDVMDGSDTRRGQPTVHVEFASRHGVDRNRGEARRFGEGIAILVGDLAHVYADRLFAAATPEAAVHWNELKIELNIGQYLDVVGTANGGVDHDRARRISRYKSGKYTIERPVEIGAALANPNGGPAPCLAGYTEPLGEAFQLRDDLLGAFGDSNLTGKPVGDDLREGKPTQLLALTEERAGAGDRALLDRIGATDLGSAEIGAIQALIEHLDARRSVEQTITELVDQAIAVVVESPIPPVAREAFAALAEYVAYREH